MASSSTHPFAAVRSVYRLFLRTSSAAVLHKSNAQKNLRRLYRPYFRDVWQVMKQMEQQPREDSLDSTWVKEWHERTDSTLKLLYTSAQTRGLPHSLTENLGFLLYDEQRRLDHTSYLRWHAHLPPNAPEYKPFSLKPKKLREEANLKSAERRADALIGNVVMLAEGRDRLSLGRIRGLKKKPKRQT